MTNNEHISKRESAETETTTFGGHLSRRNLLRTVGGTAAVGVGVGGFSSSAMADSCDPEKDGREIVFCGCTQVCWCIPFCNIAEVVTEEETIAFSDGETDEPLNNTVGYNTDEEGKTALDCFEIGDELTRVEEGESTDETLEYEGEKILAVNVYQTDGSGSFGGDGNAEEPGEAMITYCNPHTCAEKERERDEWYEENSCDKDGLMARDVRGGCGKPPCKHPARDDSGDQGPPDNGPGAPDNGQGPPDNGQGPPDGPPSQGPPEETPGRQNQTRDRDLLNRFWSVYRVR